MWLGFFIGIILGVALLALVMWLRSKAINVTWYEWLIGAIGLALLVFTIQNVLVRLTKMSKQQVRCSCLCPAYRQLY